MMKKLLRVVQFMMEVGITPALILVSALSRFGKKDIDIGLGPEPMINNIYHKGALQSQGYTAQTFVSNVYFITDDFDVRGDKIFPFRFHFARLTCTYLYLFMRSLFRYKCLYIYFNGGSLGFGLFLWRIEPLLYKISGIKVVIMPYGGDVQELSRSPNLLFKEVMARDYPGHRFLRRRIAAKIDLWTQYADHVIGGCEWVDYMYYWDTLMLAHFSIDTEAWRPTPSEENPSESPGGFRLRILHAPNHRGVKGTRFFKQAIDELVQEGFDIDLILLERVPNAEIKSFMASVDLVADQLVIGWYAMFALEAMAMGKPVLCYLREDLEGFYVASGLLNPHEIPIINCSPLTVKETIRDLALHRDKLKDIGKRSREYVICHHSIQAVGEIFHRINRSLGLEPARSVHEDEPHARCG